ncbi:ATP-dependent DNA helicase PIF4-like [Olea europaea var. sylvestris]|uniref:ATP-dependent DNA helicase PIF4-like n=1 Tax=Olea europaea var. sylvestris TaxID=158386 RepID=UPI000C1D7C84|nr:ATP-dependent DNA helicase PIF4-like [Olea europaea var. sylvestris]
MTVCDAEIRALRCINSFLEVFGTNINDFGLVDFDVIVNDADVLANMILEETTNINIQFFFIDGPGGTGKNFLYKSLLAAIRSRQLIALATSSSGVAASLLPGGRTGHSRFKIPLQASSDMRCSVSKQSSLCQLLQMTKLIVWDEAPMINRCAFETLDKMLKDITECELPFGGKVVVFGGDFRQVLPVVQRRTKDDIMKASLVFSDLWQYFIQLPLTENMRTKLDPLFCEYLLRIGNGIEREHTCHMIKLPADIIIDFESEFESLKKLIAIVFPNFHTYGDNLNTMMNRVILTPKNEHVDKVTDKIREERIKNTSLLHNISISRF